MAGFSHLGYDMSVSILVVRLVLFQSNGLTNDTLRATHSFVNKMGSLNEQVNGGFEEGGAGDSENTKRIVFEVTQTTG